jgi:hypothetical protein
VTIVAVHGIGNHLSGRSPEQAATQLGSVFKRILPRAGTMRG